MKISDYIAVFLERNQVRQVYELAGGMITHLLDSIHNRTRIRLVSMHHEQGAGFAAEGSARMTGVPGVALATSGPGATNLLTSIGSCFFDSVPAVFITGQVNRNEIRGDRGTRQSGFQETDIVAIAKSITKGAWLARDPERVPELLSHALRSATSGRPGPVLLDIPMDVQRADISPSDLPPLATCPIPGLEIADLDPMMADLARADRPLILAGGGVRAAQAVELFRQFADRVRIPVVHSLMGVDVLPYDHPLRIGMIGTYGNRWANHALTYADCLLVLGSRLDIRQTGADLGAFTCGKTIWHVDVDAAEINNRVKGCHAIVADMKGFLAVACAQAVSDRRPHLESWKATLRDWRERWPDTGEQSGLAGVNPNSLMHHLSRRFPEASAFVSDVGQHQMWAAQSLELTNDQRFLTSGGMGSMGFALPAAIGAAISQLERPVVVIAGDGGFQCNIQELEVVACNRLPLKMVVMNNRSLGMVRQFQEAYFGGRVQSTVWGYSAPDFVRVAEAYRIPAYRLEDANELERSVKGFCETGDGPALLEVRVDPKANAYPKTMFSKPLNAMEPERELPRFPDIVSSPTRSHPAKQPDPQAS